MDYDFNFDITASATIVPITDVRNYKTIILNYELTGRGNFTLQDFNNKIDEALKISENFKDQDLNFNEVRHSLSQAYTMKNERFCGTYITIEISGIEKLLMEINCFYDNNKEFIEISTSRQLNYP